MSEHPAVSRRLAGRYPGWLMLVAVLLWGHGLHAACSIPATWQERIVNLNIGRVITYPSIAVGGELAIRSFDINNNNTYAICNSTAPTDFIGALSMGQQAVPGMDHVYATNLAGVGLRMALVSNAGAINWYPFTLQANRNAFYSFRGWRLRVELVKTAADIATGDLTPGIYSTYYNTASGPGRRIMSARIISGGVSIVAPSCTVDPGSKTIAVDFGSVPAGAFHGVGSTAAEREFTIRLNCNRSVDTVDVRLDASTDPGQAPGVLQLSPTTPVAAGIGIQLLDGRSDTPVSFGGDGLELGTATDGSMSLPLKARYYQTGTPIRAGPANGTATFTLQYQ